MVTKTDTKKVVKTKIEDLPEVETVEPIIEENKTEINETKEVKSVSEKVAEKTVSKVKQVKQFSNEDMIPCICVRNNKVVYHSSKTDSRYEWNGYGDVCYVSFLDLVSLMSMKSEYLFDPCILIDDDEVLSDPRFMNLTKVYDNFLMIENPEDFFNLDTDTFKRKLKAAPKSFKDLISTTASKMVKDGTFESLSKLKALDEILGTGLHDFI